MRSVSLPIATLLLSHALWAQAGTDGSILGVVKDPAGAAVSGATVDISNLETGLARTATTDNSGSFEVLALPRGTYRMQIKAAGFSPWQLGSTDLAVAELKRISPVLKIGSVLEVVEVSGTAARVQTDKASVETAIEEKQIRDMPLNGRNPVELVMLAPGMRFLGRAGLSGETTVQGGGKREDQNSFTVDGLDANDSSTEKGIGIPNVDTIAQFSVQTANFTAENGRNPLQVAMVTKSGTNAWHGTLWHFHRNSAVDARNTFALSNPKLIRNQFGYSLGGPVLKNRLFHFTSYEGTIIRQERVYNSPTIRAEMLAGDFGARRVTDPLANNAQFPNNRIPVARFSKASQFFFPNTLLPNSGVDRFRALAPVSNDGSNFLGRVDYNPSASHRIYGRWGWIGNDTSSLGYRPDVTQNQNLGQQNAGLNYIWTINSNTLLTLAGGFIFSDTRVESNSVGKENLTQKAGIQGFPTEGRESAIGLPNVTFTGYTGFSLPAQVPARFRRQNMDTKVSMSHVVRRHTIGYGHQFNERRTLAMHSSASARGTFAFNAQYTGDGFADYLLGYLNSNERNFPLNAFGMSHSPYSGLYVQDNWKIHANLTVDLGVRYDYWHAKGLVRNSGATFIPKLGKAVASTDKNGNVDLTAQSSARFLGPATKDLWISAKDANIPRGLFQPSGVVSPRLGAAWRVLGNDAVVFRGGYGLFTGNYNGNISGSQVIGPPYWTFERLTFARATLQNWETSFPADPRAFIAPSVAAAAYDVTPMRIHEWNATLESLIPRTGAVLSLSYVANRGHDLITRFDRNEVPAGSYANLQAAKPYPAFGTIRLYENIGKSWYNALQMKAERRFQRGYGYIFSYAFSRNIDENGASVTDFPIPFAPVGYNRGRSELERRHIMTINGIWEVPLGKGRRFGAAMPRAADWIAGGWQTTGIYNFVSGTPLSFTVPGATLGNGFNTRPNSTGDFRIENRGVQAWFNPAAFQAPARFAYGSSGLGIMDGPGQHNVNLALMKNFRIAETRSLQLRWELFNAPNRVNLGDPITTIGQLNTGQITGADAARQMQFGLKFVF